MGYCSVLGLLSVYVACTSLGISFCSARSTLLIGRNRFLDERDGELQASSARSALTKFVCLLLLLLVGFQTSKCERYTVSGNNQKIHCTLL